MEKVFGFAPFCGEGAKVLILGSFPSVKSRQTQFYYGNKQNRFWKVLSEFFRVNEPLTVEEKKLFLLDNKIALWDIVTECEIIGSQDATIKNFKVADIKNLLQKSNIGLIILNGKTAERIYRANFPDINTESICLPSTSPANTRFNKEKWFNGLSLVFGGN